MMMLMMIMMMIIRYKLNLFALCCSSLSTFGRCFFSASSANFLSSPLSPSSRTSTLSLDLPSWRFDLRKNGFQVHKNMLQTKPDPLDTLLFCPPKLLCHLHHLRRMDWVKVGFSWSYLCLSLGRSVVFRQIFMKWLLFFHQWLLHGKVCFSCIV